MDKRISLQMRKCAYSQDFPQKDVVPKSQKPAQGQTLLGNVSKVRGRMGKRNEKVSSCFIFILLF